jgi:hypothetical protein
MLMTDAEPLDPGAKVNPATGMYGCSLYPICPEPQSPADTEPLDLEAIESDSNEYAQMRELLQRHDEWRTGMAEAAAEHVPALIAEVRRLREAMTEAASECNPRASTSKEEVAEMLIEALGSER